MITSKRDSIGILGSGYIFDGLDFGYPLPGNDLTKYLWDKLSETCRRSLKGTITVDMFGDGTMHVFTKTRIAKIVRNDEEDGSPKRD